MKNLQLTSCTMVCFPSKICLLAQSLSHVSLRDPMVCPWNSPGKNTGVDCHSLLHGIFPTQGSKPDLHCRQILYIWATWEAQTSSIPGQNTGVGSLSLLQEIFPTQGLNPGLPHCRWILYQLSHQGSPRILEWVAYPFSSGSSWPRNQTGVSCIAGGFFTSWATWEI